MARMKNAGSLINSHDTIEIKVPGSIANLGPGFDTLAVAVQLYLTLRVRRLPGTGHVEFRFAGYEPNGENHIERAYRALAAEHGDSLPSLAVEVRSEIPPSAGLGSSAAATVAGLRLYESVAGPVPLQALLNVAYALESHPDNAAASLLGGLTLSCVMPDGSVHATKFPWPDSLAFVVASPVAPLSTKESRALLPNSVSRADLVFNLQRVALLLQSLRSGDFSLLKYAMGDRVHQPFREGVVPGLAEAMQLKHQDLLGICLSGSGPSVVAMAERNLWEIGDLLGAVYQRLGIDYQLRILDAHQEVSARPEVFRAGLLCCS
jgi:homoserine kinase